MCARPHWWALGRIRGGRFGPCPPGALDSKGHGELQRRECLSSDLQEFSWQARAFQGERRTYAKGKRYEIIGVFRVSLETWLDAGSCGRYTWRRRWGSLGCVVGPILWLTEPSDAFPPPPQLLPKALPAWPAPSSHRGREGGRPEGCAESFPLVGLMSSQHQPRSTGAPVSPPAREQRGRL